MGGCRNPAGAGRSRDNTIRIAVGALTLLLMFLVFATQVAAQEREFEIVVPVTTVVTAPEGSETQLSVTATPEHLVGETCRVSARAANQSSVHPGNDLAVEGATRIVLADVEAVPGGVVTASDTLVLSENITVTLIMGPDGVFSAGMDVQFECPPGDTTTTTIAGTSLTSEATTTSVAPSSTVTTSTMPSTTPPTSVSPSTTIDDEVKGTEVLPFTGPPDPGLGLLALAIGACGVLLLVWARSIEVPMLSIYFTFGTSCAKCQAEAVFRTPHGLLCLADTRRALQRDQELWMPEPLDHKENDRPDGA